MLLAKSKNVRFLLVLLAVVKEQNKTQPTKRKVLLVNLVYLFIYNWKVPSVADDSVVPNSSMPSPHTHICTLMPLWVLPSEAASQAGWDGVCLQSQLIGMLMQEACLTPRVKSSLGNLGTPSLLKDKTKQTKTKPSRVPASALASESTSGQQKKLSFCKLLLSS